MCRYFPIQERVSVVRVVVVVLLLFSLWLICSCSHVESPALDYLVSSDLVARLAETQHEVSEA
jgi:hypothetical protein